MEVEAAIVASMEETEETQEEDLTEEDLEVNEEILEATEETPEVIEADHREDREDLEEDLNYFFLPFPFSLTFSSTEMYLKGTLNLSTSKFTTSSHFAP